MPHLALAHFPIALLVMAGGLLLASLVSGWRQARTVSVAMFIAGALMSIPTVAVGLWIAADHEVHHGGVLSDHRLLGIGTAVVALLGVAMHWLRRKVRNADLMRDVMLLSAAALAAGAGYLGGEMGHGGHADRGGHHGQADAGDSHESSPPSPPGARRIAGESLGPLTATDGARATPPASSAKPSAEEPERSSSSSPPRSLRADKPASHVDDGHDHAH